MGLIYKDLVVRGSHGRMKLRVLLDSGASSSFIRSDIAQALGEVARLPRAFRVIFGEGRTRVSEQIPLEIAMEGESVLATPYLLPKLSEELILGADFLQRYKVVLDFERDTVRFSDRSALRIQLV